MPLVWVTWVAFSPDEHLVTWQKEKLHWWDVVGRKLDHTLEGNGAVGVGCGAFSPGGRLLAIGAWDGQIQLLDLAAKKATPLIGHRDRMTALAFSPDGKSLASASFDQSVRLWSTAGREAAVLEGPRPGLVPGLFPPSRRRRRRRRGARRQRRCVAVADRPLTRRPGNPAAGVRLPRTIRADW